MKRRREAIRRSTAGILLLTGLIGLTGCSTAVPPSPLMIGGDPGVNCVPVAGGESILVGTVVRVTAPIVIQDAVLADSRNVRVIESYLLPVVDETGIGSSVYPPENDIAWRRRVAAAGADLKPGTEYNVVVRVERIEPADEGTATAIRVTYAADGRTNQGLTSIRYRFPDRCG